MATDTTNATGPAATSTTDARRPRRPARRLLRTEARLFLREPLGLMWGIGLPLIILVAVGSVPSSRKPLDYLDGLRTIDTYVPTLIVFALAILSLNALPTILAAYRDKAILRRLSTTPVAPTGCWARSWPSTPWSAVWPSRSSCSWATSPSASPCPARSPGSC